MTDDDRCGGCTLCCDLLAVEELDKAEHERCKHCVVGFGCAIFGEKTRPAACRAYQCAYLFNQSWPLALRPDRCGVVFEPFNEDELMCFSANVDPTCPEAWRHDAGRVAIDRMVRSGYSVIVVVGDTKHVLLAEGQTPAAVWDSFEKAARRIWQHRPMTPT